jgi:hypothetical protein
MAATAPPDKQGRGKSQKRRYFRRRRRKGSQDTSLANEQNLDDDEAQATKRARPKNQDRKRNENRRRSSRRRSSAADAAAKTVQHAVEEDRPPTDVYIYTHVIRPPYREGGGEYYAGHSLNLSGATASEPIGMDYLLESIGRQLDAWFNPPADSTAQDNSGGEANEPHAQPTDGDSPSIAEPEMADESRADDDDISPESAPLSGPKD